MQIDSRAASFEAVMAEVYEPLQRYLRRRGASDDLDDLLNDTLLAVWRRLDDIPAERVLPWCYGVARRTLANHRRGQVRRLRLLERVGATSAPGGTLDWAGEADAALHVALDRLPELDQEVIRLWAWERLEPREIAMVVGATANAVTVRLARVRRRLLQDLARQDGAPSGHEADDDHPELEP
jgi:RNA polymerase sigma-70 factor (ECF subfamily)